MPAHAVRCGRISYTNDLPVYAAFDCGAIEFPGTLREDVPTALNRALLEGLLDVSPVSSIVCAEHDAELTPLPFVCIGSRREVRSIVCVSERPIEELEGVPVAVTRDSATGRALLDTICREHGFAVTYVEADDPFAAYRLGLPCLLIGDAALDAGLAAPPDHVHDVGLLWHRLTGANMVYAVWAARADFARKEPEAVSAVVNALRAAIAWAEQHMDRVIEAADRVRPRPAGFYEAYYRTLNYHFDDAAHEGWSRFMALAQRHGVLVRKELERA